MAGHGKKHQEEESGESAPLWMITFSDMASLLMAFFVMLTTFSTFGPEESAKLRGIRQVALTANYGFFQNTPKTSVATNKASTESLKGSEKPTLEPKSQGFGKSPKDLQDFRTRKVFLMQSSLAFMANSTTLSPQGREFLDTLALFIKEVPSRIIICENGPQINNTNADFGISRSLVILKHLVEQGISADFCNIGAIGISSPENFRKERMLEIVLLDEGLTK